MALKYGRVLMRRRFAGATPMPLTSPRSRRYLPPASLIGWGSCRSSLTIDVARCAGAALLLALTLPAD